MPERDIKAYNMLLHMYCNLRELDEINRLRGQMEAEGVRATAVTHLAMLKAWSQLGLWEEAYNGLQALKTDAELAPEVNWEVAYLSAINACARASGQASRARELFDELIARPGAQVTHSHWNSLLSAHKSDPEEARKIFEEMRSAGFRPRTRDWSKLMFCERFSLERVLEVYEQMKRELGVVSDEDVFIQILTTARQHRHADTVRWAQQEMAAAGVDPRRPDGLPALRQAWESVEMMLEVSGPPAGFSADPAAGGAFAGAAEPLPAPPLPPTPAAAPPLPQGWASAVDPGTGRSYYWREADPATSTTWERPAF